MSALLPVYNRCELEFTHGEGVYLHATNGKKYLDFAAGIAVNSLGHSHPHLVRELTDQIGKLWHVSNMYQIEGSEKLASRLAENSFADYIFFCNSGVEGVECGLKIIRNYHDTVGNPDKYRVITFEGCFHGRTMAAISAAKKDKLTNTFGPLMDGFDQVSFGDLDAVKKAITPETGGILIEPILGEGGILPATKAFMQALRKLCDEHDLLFMVDEIQCGMGRSGKLFAYEWSDVAPDILASAKGIGSGFPFGACFATKNAAQGMTFGMHGSTYANNPLAIRAGNAVLDIMLEPDFLPHVNDIAAYFVEKLEELQAKHHNMLTEVRGKGLMMGIKVGMEPKDFVEKLREKHVLTVPAADNVVRLLPPLIITKEHVDEAVAAIEAVCKEA